MSQILFYKSVLPLRIWLSENDKNNSFSVSFFDCVHLHQKWLKKWLRKMLSQKGWKALIKDILSKTFNKFCSPSPQPWILILFSHPGEDGSQGAHGEDKQQYLPYHQSHIVHSQTTTRTHIFSQFLGPTLPFLFIYEFTDVQGAFQSLHAFSYEMCIKYIL